MHIYLIRIETQYSTNSLNNRKLLFFLNFNFNFLSVKISVDFLYDKTVLIFIVCHLCFFHKYLYISASNDKLLHVKKLLNRTNLLISTLLFLLLVLPCSFYLSVVLYVLCAMKKFFCSICVLMFIYSNNTIQIRSRKVVRRDRSYTTLQ